jgi:Cof subfamily protein (haloacid dehalogenase superfamily)
VVALDLDGTMLDTGGELAGGVQHAVLAALEQGLMVSAVSGRGKLALLPYLSELGLTTPYVASGGGYIAYPNDGRVIRCTEFAWEETVALANMGRAMGASLFFESSEWMLFERAPGSTDWSAGERRFTIPAVDDVLRSAPSSPLKVSIVGDAEVLAEVERRVRGQLPALTSAYTSPRCIDFYPAGVSKGSGLTLLTEHLGLRLCRTAVVGDYYNDLSMFDVAGLAVAMGNAPADVQAAADLVAPSNDEGGAAWALWQVLQMTAAELATEAAPRGLWAPVAARQRTYQG